MVWISARAAPPSTVVVVGLKRPRCFLKRRNSSRFLGVTNGSGLTENRNLPAFFSRVEAMISRALTVGVFEVVVVSADDCSRWRFNKGSCDS